MNGTQRMYREYADNRCIGKHRINALSKRCPATLEPSLHKALVTHQYVVQLINIDEPQELYEGYKHQYSLPASQSHTHTPRGNYSIKLNTMPMRVYTRRHTYTAEKKSVHTGRNPVCCVLGLARQQLKALLKRCAQQSLSHSHQRHTHAMAASLIRVSTEQAERVGWTLLQPERDVENRATNINTMRRKVQERSIWGVSAACTYIRESKPQSHDQRE